MDASNPVPTSGLDDDRALARRCVLGEAAAWNRLVRLHVPLLHAVASRVVGASEAEDVLQGVFLRLWEDGRRRLASFHGRSRLSTWLAAVAHREALDHVRRRAARERATVAEAARREGKPAPAGPEGVAAAREESAVVRAALEHLPPRDRLLVRLVHLDGLSYAEVARVLDVPENSVSPWLSRARGRLESMLAPALADGPAAAAEQAPEPAAPADPRTDPTPNAL